MQDPILYKNANAFPRRDAMEMMSTYLELVQWRGTADETVLDVGCGSGDVTWEILKPRLPSAVRVFGADISPNMITYAAKTYPDIDFFILDIGTKNLPDCWNTAFDHIFSFCCLHWIRDQRQVMQNIYNLLKPKGDLFTHYLGSHPFLDAFSNTSQLIKWKHYIPDEDAHKYANVHQHEDHVYVEERLNKILIDVGFKVSLCKALNRQYVYSTLQELRDHLRAVHPHYEKIPTNLRDEFIDDSLQELLKLNCFQDNMIYDNLEEIIIPYTLIVIVATKDIVN